jgi:hypothetical protein
MLFAGCSPWATYPPVEVGPATMVTRPTFEPVPTVMSLAIKYARKEYAPGQDLALNLPAGADWQTYEKVFERLDGGGRPMLQAGEAAIHIVEVRARAFEAEVDLIYPRTGGPNQPATLFMHRGFNDWEVTKTRLWQIRDVLAPAPAYVAPSGEELAKKKRDSGPAGETPASQAAK